MKKAFLTISVFLFISISMVSQTLDSVKVKELLLITIEANMSGTVERMPEIKDAAIYAGKKNEVMVMEKLNADLSTNNTRQIFSKVPGVTVWENDGSGIQIGIATRGLNPNRSWEFNVRQNGYDICSEIFGYPEAYYAPPMEAVQQVELIRGAASLQYGPQFGGLLNYQIKKADPSKPVSFETRQTVGSYGLFNTFNAIGLNYKKFSFYGYIQHRNAIGWRENGQYNLNSGYFSLTYKINAKMSIEADYSRMGYVSQQPGGLTDAQYNTNHRQSTRDRNWFSTPWNVASLTYKYKVNSKVDIQWKSFTTIAERNSVGFVRNINIADTIVAATLQLNTRQVDRDFYSNYGSEIRTTYRYQIKNKEHILAGGIRAYSGNTRRDQNGVGTTGSDFDLSLLNPQYGRSLTFSTVNYAAFAENIFKIGKRIKLIPGVRFEYIDNSVAGYINTTATGAIPSETRNRQVFLYGIGGEYKVNESSNIYGNYSLAYRPVTFSELTPSATTDIIDPNLKDASGYNADLGYRGSWRNIVTFDVGVFYLHYNNRIGNLTQNGNAFRTNIGTSVSKGVESYIETNVLRWFSPKTKYGALNIFASNSWINAEYTRWDNPAIAEDPTKSIENKKVENAPRFIHRYGISYLKKGFSASWQLSQVSEIFTDAANTEAANATATIGKLAGYEVMDVSVGYQFPKNYMLRAGVNNLTDERYATRRAGGYPGPGILPGNGRTFYLTFGAKF